MVNKFTMAAEAFARGYAFIPPTHDIEDESWKAGQEISAEIPTLNPPTVLVEYAKAAAAVPDNGTIIEIGCGLGATTFALCRNSKPTVKIYALEQWSSCGDFPPKWERSKCFLLGLEEPLRTQLRELHFRENDHLFEYSQESFDRRFSGQPNVQSLDLRSPPKDWGYGPADLILIDVRHYYLEYFQNILFWHQHLKPGGILAGVDYFLESQNLTDSFQEVRLAVDDATGVLGKKVTSSGESFWKIESGS